MKSNNDIEEWISAYDECNSNKRTSDAYLNFTLKNRSHFFTHIIPSIYDRTYTPQKSICFCVTKPKLREIFAAHYSDRIVQHWVTQRLEPLFEERFVSQGNVSFNCRKNYGVQAAVLRVQENIKEISENYHKEAYIGKFDLKGFFMSINKDILWTQLEKFINEKYTNEEDKETLLFLTNVIVFHCPQKNCERHGDLKLFDMLPEGKTLFKQPDNVGLPIGNITSQLFANFYMSFFDEYMNKEVEKIGGKYIRFVDDFMIIAERKNDIKKLWRKADVFLRDNLKVKLHPDKNYIQEVKHGVQFVGYVIKPNRIYLSNRTWRTLANKVYLLNAYAKYYIHNGNYLPFYMLSEVSEIVCSINSCIGFTLIAKRYSRIKAIFNEYPDILKLVKISTSKKDKESNEEFVDYRKLTLLPCVNITEITFNNFINKRYGKNYK